MLQVKFLKGKDTETLENSVNEFLASLSSEAVKDIKPDGLTTLILYEFKQAWEGNLCCDCQHWDDGGETTTSGLCHQHGQRRRFNYPSCEYFKDVRE